MLRLYKHNEAAYQAVKTLLKQTGRAAVIHPTGTGKSYIAFKLCEEHPHSRVCWLSPSRYIFDVQSKALRRDGEEKILENIRFHTYAHLSQMSLDEMRELKPDYIVLDEFHRCGAEVWGQGVRALLNMYKEVPLLGLSATNVRYLDNQRDMAAELFDGNIASEMTLGDAIVQGILKTPIYVTALYSYKKAFERYEDRVKNARDKVVRDAGERYLEQLRRALEKADNLDEIFQKYMTERAGKYIVFCANKEHMDEMVSHVPEWFGKIDREPHLYQAYSSDPETSKAFAGFVADKSDHLKLLFCIDMLNEGIHVEDVAGVILFRPTVSPIVYKQQIGRAMSAGSKNGSLILDIVDNISGLYSIGAIQQEMQQAIEVYRFYGENEKIINEQFRIIDEVQDCRKIFRELEETLSASWGLMYQQAQKYAQKNGNLEVPQFYVSEEGYPLGQWLNTQRGIYRGSRAGSLSLEQVKKLEAIGMDWRIAYERQWEQSCEIAQKYYQKNHTLSISKKVQQSSPEARTLAYWLQRQREAYSSGSLTKEQIQRLDALGMVWGNDENWQTGFEHAAQFYKEQGTLDIPAQYVSEDGYRLGNWYRTVRDQKRRGELSLERQQQMETIGVQWESVLSRNWMQYYEAAKRYRSEHGDLAVHARYVTEQGMNLGSWISSQRYAYKRGKLSDEQIELLEKLGMSWQQFSNKWNYGYDQAEEYFEINRNLNVPAEYITQDGFKLGVWLCTQRTKKRTGKLIQSQIQKLETIGMIWDPDADFWKAAYESARQYHKEHGDLLVPPQYETNNGVKLGSWIGNQRSRYKAGTLTKEQIDQLNTIGMVWNVSEQQWENGYRHLLDFCGKNDHAHVPQKYVTEDGFRLGSWLSTQTRSFKNGKLTNERFQKLRNVGVVFPVVDTRRNA